MIKLYRFTTYRDTDGRLFYCYRHNYRPNTTNEHLELFDCPVSRYTRLNALYRYEARYHKLPW